MSLLFCKQTHLSDFGEDFGGGAAIAKSLFLARWQLRHQNFRELTQVSSSQATHATLQEDKQARSPWLNPWL